MWCLGILLSRAGHFFRMYEMEWDPEIFEATRLALVVGHFFRIFEIESNHKIFETNEFALGIIFDSQHLVGGISFIPFVNLRARCTHVGYLGFLVINSYVASILMYQLGRIYPMIRLDPRLVHQNWRNITIDYEKTEVICIGKPGPKPSGSWVNNESDWNWSFAWRYSRF